MAAPVTRNLTILLTDIKGFTDKTSHKSRSAIQEMLERHKAIVLPTLESRGGKLVKTIGDAFLMVYESPTDAVLAGVAVQGALTEHNQGRAEDDRIDVRIAINLGEVNLSDNDIFGEPVNITARIEGVAEAGEVFFTEAVYLAMNKQEVPSSEVGLLQLKGIPEKIRVYKVRREHPVAGLAAVSPAGGRRLWDFLKTQAPRPAGPGTVVAPRPALWRRAAALLVDGLLVAILTGMLTGGDRHDFDVKLDRAAVKKAASGPKKPQGVVIIDSKGIQAEEGDVKVRLDHRGLRVESPEARVLHDKDGLRVTQKTEKKDPTFAIFWTLYGTLFLAWWGATPGKRILKLKVLRQDGAVLDWRHALVRTLFSLVSGTVLFLGFLWALWEKDGRGWHDLIAGTRVVPAD